MDAEFNFGSKKQQLDGENGLKEQIFPRHTSKTD
jgi:hypothetical protein